MNLQLGVSDGQGIQTGTRDVRRILMSVDAVGGVWRYVMDLSKSLQQRGVRAALIGFGPPPSPAQRAEAETAQLPLTWNDLPLDWMPGGLSALTDAKKAIRRASANFKADVIHVNSLAYAAPDLGAPVVAVAHSCIPTWWRAVRGEQAPACWRPHLSANAAGLRAAACIIAPSHAHARQMRVEYGGDLDIRVVYNASAGDLAVRQTREPIVFAAGRWWDDAKNARILDEAARRTKWPVVMAGSLNDPSGNAKIISHARALGSLDSKATQDWMRRASAFVAPSLYEPFGLAILEAASASTPLVLADIPTFRELWDGAALFAAPDDPDAFATAFEKLMNDARLRQALACRARAQASRFTLDRQTDAILSAYRAAADATAGTNLRSAV
jgi:glycosyltransferase involved in cell wall biosynthesis